MKNNNSKINAGVNGMETPSKTVLTILPNDIPPINKTLLTVAAYHNFNLYAPNSQKIPIPM